MFVLVLDYPNSNDDYYKLLQKVKMVFMSSETFATIRKHTFVVKKDDEDSVACQMR